MLKKRIIASVNLKNDVVVQTKGFQRYLPIGSLSVALEFLNNWGADEIIITDISATIEQRVANNSLLREASKKCFVPVTVGGGIRSLIDVRNLLLSGADKVVVNSVLRSQPGFITEVSKKFGRQCIGVSVDVIAVNGEFKVYDYVMKETIDLSLSNYLKNLVDLGAGELFIRNVNRDGSQLGFDVELAVLASKSVDIPVIISGGAGSPDHFLDVFHNSEVDGACSGNYFQFMEHSIALTKSFLFKNGVNVRMDPHNLYLNHKQDSKGRLVKLSDLDLEKLTFERIIEKAI